MKEFSIKLKELRESKNLSQENLAKELKVSRGKVGHWETGRTEPSLEELVKISNFFNCRLDYIIDPTVPKTPIIYKEVDNYDEN